MYNNDKYNYKQLYGNAEPPSLKQSNNVQQLAPTEYISLDEMTQIYLALGIAAINIGAIYLATKDVFFKHK